MVRLKKYLLYILLIISSGLLLTNIIIHFWDGWKFTVYGTTLFNNLVTPIATIISIWIYTWTLFELIKQNRINHSNNLKPYFERRFDYVLKRLNEKIYRVTVFRPQDSGIQFDYHSTFSILVFFKEAENKILNDPEYQYDLNLFNSGQVKKRELYDLTTYVRFYVKYLELFFNHGLSGYIKVIDLIKEVKGSSLIDEDKQGFLNLIRHEMTDPYIDYLDSIRLTDDYFMIPRVTMPDKEDFIHFEPFFKSAISNYYEFFIEQLYPERKEGV